jgi:hypothetical protein
LQIFLKFSRKIRTDTSTAQPHCAVFLSILYRRLPMKKALLSAAVGMLAASYVLPAMANDGLVKFGGGIGSQPFASINGQAAPNDVLTIPPGGRPWFINKLKAVVRVDSTISVKGEGLILGGGGNVGLPAVPRQVVATLFCGGAAFTSAPTDLDANGDFTIRGSLPGVVPNPCTTPILLIRNFANNLPGPWFAAGIPEN